MTIDISRNCPLCDAIAGDLASLYAIRLYLIFGLFALCQRSVVTFVNCIRNKRRVGKLSFSKFVFKLDDDRRLKHNIGKEIRIFFVEQCESNIFLLSKLIWRDLSCREKE